MAFMDIWAYSLCVNQFDAFAVAFQHNFLIFEQKKWNTFQDNVIDFNVLMLLISN